MFLENLMQHLLLSTNLSQFFLILPILWNSISFFLDFCSSSRGLPVPNVLAHRPSLHNGARVIKSPRKGSLGPVFGRNAKTPLICTTKYLSSPISFSTIGVILIRTLLVAKDRLLLASSPKGLDWHRVSKNWPNNPALWASEVPPSLRNYWSHGSRNF